ncbi:hypothetical protein A8U91_02526 [Halomonas elongata]|uniref:Uncharacterized protein n=1 Tax=Halomonas elongata TaxID=2746 RepID=A0A1B8P7E5_HALEL|nr:hypothetical protein [Halomonas elongata]OBX38140.1 hypothetical protein A8U91_02526 [Halomonas elongata]
MANMIREMGRRPVRRNTLYRTVATFDEPVAERPVMPPRPGMTPRITLLTLMNESISAPQAVSTARRCCPMTWRT